MCAILAYFLSDSLDAWIILSIILISSLLGVLQEHKAQKALKSLLDLVDVPGRYTDNNWGWDDDRDIGIRRVSSGYLIDVAEPKYLD